MTATSDRGLATVGPQSITAAEADWDEVRRIFAGMVDRNTDPNMVTAALMVCQQFGFNPILKHIFLIKGDVYISHKGLLNLAHRSGVFDGIEVLDQAETQTHFTAKVAVYRKDMRRPFIYSGRYSKQGHQRQYGPEMAVTRAECMALRRAFDVGLPIYEEINWQEQDQRQEERATVTVREVPPAQLAAAVPARTVVVEAGDWPEAMPAEEHFGWTEFWSWARARGFNDRKSLDEAAGKATGGLTPAEIRALIVARAAQQQPQAPQSPADQAEAMLEWLSAEQRTMKQQEILLGKLFALSDDQEALEGMRAAAHPLAHQDAIDGAWHDRMTELGRPVDAFPAADEEEQVEDEAAAWANERAAGNAELFANGMPAGHAG